MGPWRTIIAILVCGFVTPAVSDPIPDGPGEQTVMLGEQPFVVFTYRPVGCSAPQLLLLFHGNGGVPRYRDYARPLADKACMIVIAPRFDKRRFSGARYQRGGMVAGVLRLLPDLDVMPLGMSRHRALPVRFYPIRRRLASPCPPGHMDPMGL